MGRFKNPWGKGGEFWPPTWMGEEDEVTAVLDPTQDQNTSAQSQTKTALICYGNGADLGNFEIFAKSLKKNDLSKKYKEGNIKIVKSFNREDLVNAFLNSSLNELSEIHIFSHSAGAGLFLGYHIEEYGNERNDFIANHPHPTYDEVVANEIASLLTDHLIITYSTAKEAIQKKLKNLLFVKLWGCNTGVSGWVYDNSPYWGALNDKNVPKPSMAQALANFLDATVFGANSGSHIEYYIKGKWVSGYDYTPKSSKEYTDIRLYPDRGNFDPYSP